ncbi:hypothetical protein K501DRAFT_308178 [Backusella circina FSU 941]|nr:hypothetical protein K501DRAFT_308178 [Backusella circina FSU 941]
MLVNLPLDVIISITGLLSFNDKLNLIKTCHKMNDLVSTWCLFESVSLHSSKDNIENAIMNFRRNPLLGKQVKYLSLDLDELSNQLYGQLPVIFPNVIRLSNSSEDLEEERPEDISNQFIKWKNTLQYLSVDDEHCYTFRLLRSNVFSNLIKLKISSLAFGDIEQPISHETILECIRNAPLLEILFIVSCKITIAFLEKLHSSCPQLYDVSICDAIILINNGALPEIIVPAIRMVKFRLSDTTIIDRNCLFLRYITQKYTRLSVLNLGAGVGHDSIPEFLTVEEDDDDELELALVEDHLSTKEIYREEGVSILSKMAHTIKKLTIDTRYFGNLTGVLHPSYSKLTELSVLEKREKSNLFKEANQLGLLQNLPSLQSLHFAVTCSLQGYGYNMASTSVTYIDIAIMGTTSLDDLDIGWILTMFPSLEKMCIEYSSARLICYDDEVSSLFPRLSSVKFGISVVHPELFNSLYKIAPNIKEINSSIYGTGLKRATQAKHETSNIVIPTTSVQILPGNEHYRIDLTACDVDVFHLNVKLGKDPWHYMTDYVLLVNSRYFIITKGTNRASAERNCLDNECKRWDQITITTRHTKMLKLNDTIVIDPSRGSIGFM